MVPVVSIKFTQNGLNLVVEALRKCPMELVEDLVNDIKTQVAEFNKSLEQAPAEPLPEVVAE